MATRTKEAEKIPIEPKRLALFEVPTNQIFSIEGEQLYVTGIPNFLLGEAAPFGQISLSLKLYNGGGDLKKWADNGGKVIVSIDVGDLERPEDAAKVLVELKVYARYFEKSAKGKAHAYHYKSQNPQLEIGFICGKNYEDFWNQYRGQNAKFRIFLSVNTSA